MTEAGGQPALSQLARPLPDKAEEHLLRVLERRGKRGFIVIRSAEAPLIRYRRGSS